MPDVQDQLDPKPGPAKYLILQSDYPERVATRVQDPNVVATFMEFGRLAHDFVNLSPFDVVVSPIIGESFDCLDVAEFLSLVAFKGTFCIVVVGSKDPSVMARELSRQFPELDIKICDR